MPPKHKQDAFDNTEQQNFGIGRTSSTSGNPFTGFLASSSCAAATPPRWATSEVRADAHLVGSGRTVRSQPHVEIMHGLFVLLLFKKAGRLRF